MLTTSELDKITVHYKETLKQALASIDANCCGFVIVCDEHDAVYGTLTDGDIRRALLRGSHIDDSIQAAHAAERNFTWLSTTQGIDDAIDIFKQGSIEFIPVLDTQRHLANVLLKKQLYSLLLQCQIPDLNSDFTSIDENLVDFEVFNRPWGIYKTTTLQPAYQSKVLQVRPGAKLSLQYHRRREEYWTVAAGQGCAQVGDSYFLLHPGSHVVIPKGCMHRLQNTSDTEWLVVIEVQVGDYFGEDDIVRIEDDYGRVDAEHA